MELDKKLTSLPLTKSNPNTLLSIFGNSDLVPVWVADMDFEVAKPIQKALIERITNSGFGYEYKPESFYLAQRNWYKKQYNIDLKKDSICYSPTITTTISIAIERFTSERDGIIIQPPVFMEFRDVIRKTKRKVVKNPLKLSDGYYEIDFVDLEEKAKENNNKVLIICNPHNPVGRVWKKEELERIIVICKKHNLLLISDEIHKDIILFKNQFTSILNGDLWLNDLIKTIEKNVISIEQELEGSSIKLIQPEGTYQVWVDFSAMYNDSKDMFNHITENTKIAMNAGHWFGREGALFMRMNIATSNVTVIKAIKKIKKVVSNYV